MPDTIEASRRTPNRSRCDCGEPGYLCHRCADKLAICCLLAGVVMTVAAYLLVRYVF